MGKNKDIRKQIAGHEQNIWKPHLKIEEELRRDCPRENLIEKWRDDIRKAEARIDLLTGRLERRRKNALYKKS